MFLFVPRPRDFFGLGNDVDDVPGTATKIAAVQPKALSAAYYRAVAVVPKVVRAVCRCMP